MTAKIIKPNRIDDNTLNYTSVTEPADGEPLAWDSETDYDVEDEVISLTTHRRYRAVASSSGVNPATDISDPPKWLDIGPTLRWAMFDQALGTHTSAEGDLTVRMVSSGATGIALLQLTGRYATVLVRDGPGGTVVYEREVELDGSLIDSFYAWFFEPFEQLDRVILTDLPGTFLSGEIEVEIEGTGTVACGECVPGRTVDLGRAQYGARVGILDWSVKERTPFGAMNVVERGYSNRANITMLTEKADFQRIFTTLASLRATACVYVGAQTHGYEPLTIYGFYRDFEIVVSYPSHHLLSIDIEGIV